MKYKLLVLDLDGTLTNAKKEITPRNREALIRVQQQGVKLILASGRPTFGIAPLADELRMKEFGGFILSYNGGEIIDWSTGEIVYANVLPDEVIPRLYECATRNQLPILTYDRQYIITEYPDDVYVRKEAFLNKMQIYPSKDFLKDIRLPLPKCLIVGEPHRLIPIEAELSVELQGQLNVYRSEPFFLELVPQGIDKAQSLSVLLNKLNMNREEMVAVGDGYNDLSMIQFAGLGVAMRREYAAACQRLVRAGRRPSGQCVADLSDTPPCGGVPPRDEGRHFDAAAGARSLRDPQSETQATAHDRPQSAGGLYPRCRRGGRQPLPASVEHQDFRR